MTNYTQERLESSTATILSGQTESSAIDVLGKVLVGIITPAALTGTAFTLKVSQDGTTFRDYYNTSGSQVSITVGTNRHIGIVSNDFGGIRWIKLVSGSAEGADRNITVILRGM
jgi:hypothetical protein